jgi:biotin carboxyl carrier protein
MKKFKFTINGNDYTVDIHGIEENLAHLEVNGTPYNVELHRQIKTSKTPTLIRSAIKQQAIPDIQKREVGSSHPILAPLPGAITKLEVGKGDIVKKGQLLLIMEAMKMENRVLADRAGVVEVIRVNQGDVVLQGDVIMEIV